MAIGTLYGNAHTRTIVPCGLVKAFGLDIDIVESKTEAHLKAFPRGLAPAFIGEKGFKISESLAVNYYRMSTFYFQCCVL